MEYDISRQVSILCGGVDSSGVKGDTWQWDGQDWTQLSDSGPAPRAFHTIAFDSFRARSVLFGGLSSATQGELADTWEFDGEQWTQQEDTGPSARSRHGMAYDSASGRVILFGGINSSNLPLGDTWTWDGTVWAQVAEFGPSPRSGAAMAFIGDGTVLFGGQGPENILGDTWEFVGKRWTKRQDIGPAGRFNHAMAFDSGRMTVVLFGGAGAAAAAGLPSIALGDTWEHREDEPAQVSVLSLQLSPNQGGTPGSNTVVTATLVLSGPAPPDGVTIQMFFSVATQLFLLPIVSLPAGVITAQSVFTIPSPVGDATVSAQVPGTAAATAPFTGV
jgi:hypothetical protein